jgi:hypothetical protein
MLLGVSIMAMSHFVRLDPAFVSTGGSPMGVNAPALEGIRSRSAASLPPQERSLWKTGSESLPDIRYLARRS